MVVDKSAPVGYSGSAKAGVAQLVEPHVANVIVAGSSPVSCFFLFFVKIVPHQAELAPDVHGGIAKW